MYQDGNGGLPRVTRIKICGITNLDDARCAAEAGADMLGFIFHPPSPRYVTPDRAGRIVRALRVAHGRRAPRCVGVFVNEPVADVQATLEGAELDWAQLHGDEPSEVLRALAPRAYKAIRPETASQARVQAAGYAPLQALHGRPDLLVDAHHPGRYGGTGLPLDPVVARAAAGALGAGQRLLLAGGLTPERVREVVLALSPWGVDVSSGVEAEPGRKDHAKIVAFVAAVRRADVMERDRALNGDRDG
jgi:phosphoribosylanthranilate isomerase